MADTYVWDDGSVHYFRLSEDEALALGYFRSSDLPGAAPRAEAIKPGFRVSRCRDGRRVNVHIDADHALTRGDTILTRALQRFRETAARHARRDAQASAEPCTCPPFVKLLADLTRGMDVYDQSDVYQFVKQLRARRGFREAQAAKVVDIARLRELRFDREKIAP